MAKLILLVALAMGAPALAAQKAPPKAKPADKAPAAAAAAPAAAEGDAEVQSAGKVIEIDPSGGAKVVKGEAAPAGEKLELKKGEIGVVEACQLRFKAQCSLLKRCLKTEELDCDALAYGCSQLSGKAPFTRKLVEDCTAAVSALSCEPPSDQLDANPENRAAVCKPLLLAEQQAPAPEAPPAASNKPPSQVEAEPDLTGYKTIDVPQDAAPAAPGQP